MALFDIIQQDLEAFSTGATTISESFGSNLTAGNTLILMSFDRSGQQNPTPLTGSVTGDPATGWVEAVDLQSEIDNSSFRRHLMIWYAHTDAFDVTDTTHGCTYDNSTSGIIQAIEIEGALELDKTATADSGTNQVDSQSTGTTATTAEADEFLFATLGIRHGQPGTPTFTNSFVKGQDTSSGGTTSQAWVSTATLVVSSTGTYETTGSWTNAEEASAAIATFVEAGAAGGQTVAVGTLTETEALLSIEAEKPILASVGTITESDDVIAVTAAKQVAINIVEETDTIVVVQSRKFASIAALAESDSIVEVEVDTPQVVGVGLIATTEDLVTISAGNIVAVGIITQTDGLITIEALKPIVVEVPILTEANGLIVPFAGNIVVVDAIAQIESLLAIEAVKPVLKAVGLVTEVNDPVAILGQKVASVATISEAELLVGIASTKLATVEVIAEIEALISIGVIKPIEIAVSVISQTESLISITVQTSLGTSRMTFSSKQGWSFKSKQGWSFKGRTP